MKVLVCGGRDFNDTMALQNFLDGFHSETPITLVIHGSARGADRLAGRWAESRGIPVQRFPVKPEDWANSKAAGVIRNQRMLDEGKPDWVIAFPGKAGTNDMIGRARKAGVNVVRVQAQFSGNR